MPYVTEQSEYSWLARDAESELLPTCERLGLGFIPYFPLASGLLTGKVSRDRPPAEGTRLHGSELDDEKLDRVERYRAWAEAHGVSLLDVAVGGLAAVSPVASVIAGATKPEQVRANAAAGAWEPTPDELVGAAGALTRARRPGSAVVRRSRPRQAASKVSSGTERAQPLDVGGEERGAPPARATAATRSRSHTRTGGTAGGAEAPLRQGAWHRACGSRATPISAFADGSGPGSPTLTV